MEILSSHPFYIKKEDCISSHFESFLAKCKDAGMAVSQILPNTYRISPIDRNVYNNIIVYYPDKPQAKYGICKFYNADGLSINEQLKKNNQGIFTHHISIGIGLMGMLDVLTLGNNLKNPERIMNEAFCKSVLKLFLSTIPVYKCPNCGGYTFTMENWEKEESRFSEERVGNGLNAIGCILLGGHGAGGYWSQATKPRKKESGYKLSCNNWECNHSESITTNSEYI